VLYKPKYTLHWKCDVSSGGVLMAEPTKRLKKKESVQDCVSCKAECCKSVTVEINTPKTKQDFDEVKWFILHENVMVYIDHDKNWNVEFVTKCKSLGPDNRCLIYEIRPAICRLYPKKGESCVYGTDACKKRFTTVEEVTAYFEAKQKRRASAKIRAKKQYEKMEKQ